MAPARRREIADVGDGAEDAGTVLDELPQGRRGGRLQRVTGDPRPERREPEGEPSSLEAGVAGDEDTLAGPEVRSDHHDFQGGLPLAHSSSR